MTIWYVDFCIIKLYMLISYQDQDAIVPDNIPLPILQPIPYPPVGQPFLKNNIHYLNLGMLTIICSHCYALHFDCEKLTSLRVNYPKFGMCCLQGQIQLPPLQPLTGILHNYLTGDDYSSREFCNNIRQYNAAFVMTSVGVKIDNSVTRQSGPYYFKIQGELYHLTGALLPHGNQTPMYVQIYILDTVEQLNVRRANNHNLDPVVMDNLQTMLLDNHLYIGHYRHAYELIREKPVEEQEEITIRLYVNLQQDQRTHNLPTAEEITVIIPEDGVYHALDNRDVVLQARGG